VNIVKKKLKLIYTTGTTETNCTNCFKFIPDTGITYNFQILLTQDVEDLGLFTPYPIQVTGLTGFTNTSYTVTGYSFSRLPELRKASFTGNTSQLYYISSGGTSNGVDLNLSSNNFYVYYIDGITYTTIISGTSSGTTFSFIGNTINPNFTYNVYYKDPNLEAIVGVGNLLNNIDIERPTFTAFDGNKLEVINNLARLLTYAGGSYFNIVNNS